MHPLRQSRRGTWAPKALAIVSFALAMLAMQPMVDAGTPAGRPAVVVKEISAPLPAQPRLVPVRSAPASRTWRAAEVMPATARLHMLATVEILHRLLISELNVEPQPVLFAYLPCMQQICIDMLPPATAIRYTVPPQCAAMPPPAERIFAISHQLLAPPVA
jgi:hypothetical protein